MAKPGQRAEVNTFIQGLITEASPLNFPPNASKEEENFILYRDGTRRRRFGMDFEEGFEFNSLPNYGTFPPPISKMNTFIWKSAGNIPDQDFLVVQAGEDIDIYNLDDESVSSNYLTTFTLTEGNTECSFANVEGRLVIANGTSNPYIITFNGFDVVFPTTVFQIQTLTLKVRDLWGVASPDVDFENDRYYQPTVRDGFKVYNWANQSWGIVRRISSGAYLNPVQLYVTDYSKYPSNSEVVWTALQFQPVAPSQSPFEAMYPNLWKEVFGVSSLAAKGFFIIDALNRGASRLAEYTKLYNKDTPPLLYPPAELTDWKDDITPGGPKIVTSYAGRAWYAGFTGQVIDGDARSPILSNYLMFSQLVRNINDIHKCYQDGDPTSREGSDIVDTDGGFLKIEGLGIVLGLQPIGNDLIVLADNGVWAVTGGSDYGFTATNYKVNRISSFGAIAAHSVVLEGDKIYYWGQGGIYVIGRDQFGALRVQSVSKTTIQSFFDKIPLESMPSVKGIYDDRAKKIRWLYKEGDIFTLTSKTLELVIDTDLGNFSLNTIKNVDSVNIEAVALYYYNGMVKYIAYNKTGATFDRYTFAEYRDTDFLDWKSFNDVGVDAKAFVLTGAQVAGDSAVFKQAPYLVIHMTRTETETDASAVPENQSSCLFNVRWDWANSDKSNKVSQLQQAYRYRRPFIVGPETSMDTGFDIVTTRNKIRGRGRSLALYMETEPGKDCHILGWNITLNGNAVA